MIYRIQGDFFGERDFESDTPVLVGDIVRTERNNTGDRGGRVSKRKFLVDKNKVEFIFLTIGSNNKE